MHVFGSPGLAMRLRRLILDCEAIPKSTPESPGHDAGSSIRISVAALTELSPGYNSDESDSQVIE
jgi:hypothetical protein